MMLNRDALPTGAALCSDERLSAAFRRDDECPVRVNDDLLLLQKKDGLSFGTDALLLAAFCPPSPAVDAVELGAGSGIVSLLCAARGKFGHIECVEVQPAYADLCRRNVSLNRLDGRVSVTCADLRDHAAFATGRRVGHVFANPPYIKANGGRHSADEGRDASKREVFGGIDDFCAAAAEKLCVGGSFSLVYHPARLTDLFCALRSVGLEPKRMTWVCAREGLAPSLFLLSAKKGVKPALTCTPVLYLTQNGETSPAMQTILSEGTFPF